MKLTFAIVAAAFLFFFFLYLSDFYYHYDDAFVTYLFARNIGEGHGFVFYPHATLVQGSSTLLYTLIISFIFSVTKIEPHFVGWLLSPILYVGWCLLAADLVRSRLRLGMYQALSFLIFLLLFQVPLLLSLGMETALLLVVQILTIREILSKHPWRVGICSAVTFFIRPDYLVTLPFVLLSCWIARIALWKILTVCVAGIALYVTSTTLYFGTPVPQTWIAKRLFPSEVSGSLSWFQFCQHYPLFSLGIGTLLSSAVAAFFLNRPQNAEHVFIYICLFAAGVVTHSLFMVIGKAPDMPWYYAPSVAFLYLASLTQLATVTGRAHPFTVAIATTLLLYWNYLSARSISVSFDATLAKKLGNDDRREKLGRYLAANVPEIENKTILLYEAGKIPYFSRAKAVDLLGLVSPEAMEGMRQQNTTVTFRAVKPDFVAGVPRPDYFPMRFLADPEFVRDYVRVKRFGDYILWERAVQDRQDKSVRD